VQRDRTCRPYGELRTHGYTARVRRARTVAALAGCGLAGLLVALVVAGAPAAIAQTGTTGTTTGVTDTAPPTVTATAPAATTTAPAPTPRPAQPDVIAAGVTVGRVLVGGLSPAEANALIRERFARSLPLVVSSTRRIRITPRDVGASAYVTAAVKVARRARAGASVPLKVKLRHSRVEGWLRSLGKELRHEAVDARLVLRGSTPVAIEAKPGRRLKELAAQRAITLALKTHERTPVRLPFEELKPKVTADTLGPLIVIRRGSNRLLLYQGLKLKRIFHVATGQSRYPTPLGRFQIEVKWRNPWWNPPPSDWAQDSKPIPPGPGNPLGTRWMGLSAPYVGIHGTPDATSIGYSVSHGCIRMLIPQVEWLFEQVEIGTPVFVVSV
jgi:lipoprotein-anchoring transpeptidase ErfK/SrfK